ncbi:MAG: FAD-dependent oxidoreductase [Balneolales bacterium]
MVIGVIGAGLSGLIAGKTLAEAGHEVVVFEKSGHFGGRLASSKTGGDKQIIFDYGVPYFHPESDEFKAFIQELEEAGLVEKWCETLSYSDGKKLFDTYPGKERSTYYMAPDGMNGIARYLSRWLDFRTGVPVSSMTFIGSNRKSKRNWMITMSDINTFELDAVIIATPSTEAYGLIQTSQDELAFRKLIQSINRIEYEPCISLMADYGKREIPEWKGIICQDDRLQWISNENSKRQNSGELGIVFQSTGEFAKKYINSSSEQAVKLMLERAEAILGPWAARPIRQDIHIWKYNKPRNPLKVPYLELIDHPTNVALVGDYFGKQTIETAYLSGFRLGKEWINKLEPQNV